MIVNCRQPEPTLEDILSDSIIKAVMKAEGVDPLQLAAMLKEVGRRWAGGRGASVALFVGWKPAGQRTPCTERQIVVRDLSRAGLHRAPP
jgi:hypothetical protein